MRYHKSNWPVFAVNANSIAKVYFNDIVSAISFKIFQFSVLTITMMSLKKNKKNRANLFSMNHWFCTLQACLAMEHWTLWKCSIFNLLNRLKLKFVWIHIYNKKCLLLLLINNGILNRTLGFENKLTVGHCFSSLVDRGALRITHSSHSFGNQCPTVNEFSNPRFDF